MGKVFKEGKDEKIWGIKINKYIIYIILKQIFIVERKDVRGTKVLQCTQIERDIIEYCNGQFKMGVLVMLPQWKT